MAARIIFKAHYLSGEKSQHIENYLQYMGTRPGVEIFDDDGSPATEKQKQLIEQLLEDFGKEMTDTFEYEDYLAKPTKANASAAITACVDTQYSNTATKENYIDYIANRPRVEKLGEHGLFAQTDAPLDLDEIAHEVAHQGNNVWTDIISLRREDAIATGFDNATAWRDLLRGKVETIARNYKIPLRDFVWYAAFHNEGHHPHVHFVCYSNGNEGFLTEKGIENIKSSLAHEIFKQEFSEIYGRQTQLRTNIKDESTQLMEQLARNISESGYEDTELKNLIIELADHLDNIPGKKQYGYLTKDTKSLVDAITERLTKHESIAKLYELWYEQKEEIMKMYQSAMPEHIPLSKNKEFISVKNMIIHEVSQMKFMDDEHMEPHTTDEVALFDELDCDFDFDFDFDKDVLSASNMPLTDDADLADDTRDLNFEDDIEVSVPAKSFYHQPRTSTEQSKKLYWLGKQFLNDGEELEAIECFKMSAEQGNSYAQYRLGKLYLSGTDTLEKDVGQALQWLQKSVDQGNEYAQYTLGNVYLNGERVPVNMEKGEELLRKSATQGNAYAAYRYGCLLRDVYEADKDALCWIQKAADGKHPGAMYTLCKLHMQDDVSTATEYLNQLELLDRHDNSLISYYLGRLYLMDGNISKDVPKAISYLEKSAELGNNSAMYTLGKLYFLGEATPQDVNRGIWYLEQAIANENDTAMFFLGRAYLMGNNVPKNIQKGLQLLQNAAALGNEYASKVIEDFNANTAHIAISILYRLSKILQGNTAALSAKTPTMPAVDKKEWIEIMRKKSEHGIRYD